jgi:DNA primase
MSHEEKFVDFRAVKAAVTMEQVLDHYALVSKLSRKGDTFSGPCPLHNGTNPTQFRVSLSKNCWNCFGDCKRGGNVLDFVALKEGASVREAALLLADWFHLAFGNRVPEPKRRAQGQQRDSQPVRSKRQDQQSVVDEDAPNKPLGFQLQNLDIAHPYLDERGLTKGTIAEFGLGYCNNGSMSGRIVIPIHNPDGRIVAYAGRWPGAPPDDTPKYKLPPGFKKSQELFNIHRAFEHKGQPLVIVEGFFDCIKLWQLGCKRVVALMGSTLSIAQAELLSRSLDGDDRVIVMMDEDDAGRSGGAEALQQLATRTFAKLVHLQPEGQQPEGLSLEALGAILEPSKS